MATDSFRRCLWAALLMGAAALHAGPARADVPKELFDTLKVDQSATPKQRHHNQNKCDTCHTRHEFSVVEARKTEGWEPMLRAYSKVMLQSVGPLVSAVVGIRHP